MGDLPQESPEGQPQVPAAVTRVVPCVLLGQAPVGNPGAEEQLELVEGVASGGAQAFDLVGEGASPDWKVGSHKRYGH